MACSENDSATRIFERDSNFYSRCGAQPKVNNMHTQGTQCINDQTVDQFARDATVAPNNNGVVASGIQYPLAKCRGGCYDILRR